MISRGLIGVAGADGSVGITFKGGVTRAENTIHTVNSSGEAVDVLSVASVGDLVVVAVSVGKVIFSYTEIEWGGMPFTQLETFTNPASYRESYYLGYRVVEAGDSNPYLTTYAGYSASVTIVCGVFGGDWSSVSAASSAQNNGLTPPSLSFSGNLWINSLHLGDSSDAATTPPSGYTEVGEIEDTTSGGYTTYYTTTSLAYKIATSSSETPGAFSNVSTLSETKTMIAGFNLV